MPTSLEARIAALEALEQRSKPPEPDDAADAIAEALGLSPDDPLAPVLAAAYTDAEIARMLRGTGEDTGPRDAPSPVLEALGLPVDATGEAVLEAARSGLRRDATGFRERVLAANARQTESASRYSTERRAWIPRDAWWLSPGEWERSVTADEAGRLAMAANPPAGRGDLQ